MPASSSEPITIPVGRDFRGYFNGITKAKLDQRVTIESIRVKDKFVFAIDTFEASGSSVLKSLKDHRQHFSFGPFPDPVELKVTIKHKMGNEWKPSEVIGPFKIHKEEEHDFPMEFYQTTITSKDGDGSNLDDCTVTVVLYKEVLQRK